MSARLQETEITRYGITVDLTQEGHVGCPKCISKGNDNSRNNLMVYGLDSNNEHLGGKCFACGYTIPSVEWLRENGDDIYEEEEEIVGSEFNPEVHNKLKAESGTDPKGYRGIREDISKPFGVRYKYDRENQNIIKSTLYPVTKNYEISGYKQRIHPKDFTQPIGETGKDCDLFGQFKFKTFTNTLLIVGGEHDQLSAYQMLLDAQKNKSFDPVAVVSGTTGESSLFRQLQKNYDFLNQFKKIVICMDSDAAGKEAMERAYEVLPKGKVFVMKMRLKDPNSYIYNKERAELVHRESEFISDFWSAKPYTPDGVKSAADGFDEIDDELSKERITLPGYMHVMQAMMGGGMIQGRIANVIADTSSGKSTHVNRMVHHWIFHSPVTPTIVSLEATAAQYMLEMMSIHMEVNLLWKMTSQEIKDFIKTEEGQRIKHELCYKENGQPRFFILDDRAGSIKDLEAELEMLFRKHDSRLFVIDVLSDLLRGSSEQHAEDHMNFQRNMAKNGVTTVNVQHTRKPPQNAEGKPRKVTEYDTLGTGSFVQSAAYNIVLNRDKLSEDPIEKNTTEVDLPKCRGGKTGPAGKWFYEFDKAKCHDLEDYFSGNRAA